jgi:hypothetical protein
VRSRSFEIAAILGQTTASNGMIMRSGVAAPLPDESNPLTIIRCRPKQISAARKNWQVTMPGRKQKIGDA